MPRIAFWRTLRDAYGFAFGDWRRLPRMAGPWIVLLLAAQAALDAAMSPVFRQRYGAPVIGLAGFIGYLSFSVAWHRAVLKGEMRSTIAAFRFGRRELRFLGKWLAIALLIGIPTILIWFQVMQVLQFLFMAWLKSEEHHGADIRSELPVLLFISLALDATLYALAWIPASRLALALPATAVDVKGAVIAGAWELGKGNAVALYFGPFLCVAPFFVLDYLSRWVLEPRLTLPAGLALGLANAVSSFLSAAVVVGFYSFAYKQIVGPVQAIWRDDPLNATGIVH